MITYIDSNNRQNYTVLFDMASAKLGLAPVKKETGIDAEGNPIIENYKYIPIAGGGWDLIPCEAEDFDEDGNFLIVKDGSRVISEGISSLNEYFQHIEELSELAVGNGRTGSDPYFLRLPLDEPFFEINANTRGITVPGELSQVGVVGDKFAEVIFFRMDRYFDAVDLDTRHIYIEWELPDGTRGISRDFLRDTQSEKDKIIFGWLIDDILTAQTGTIRFAVRFVEWTDRGDEANTNAQLLYSFSSLPATISISDSLHYTLFEDDEELQYTTLHSESAIATMAGIFENSSPDSPDASALEPANEPVFIRDLDVNATLIPGTEMYTRNLEGGAKNQPAGSLTLIAEAYADDSGSISYKFSYKATEESGAENIPLKKDLPFIEVSDHSDENRLYYIRKANGAFQPVTQTDIANLGEGVQLYERVGAAVINRPGFYRVYASNRVFGRKTNTAKSVVLYIPYAAMPEVTTPMIDHFVISEQTFEKTLNENTQTGRFATSNIEYAPAGDTGAATVELSPAVIASDDSSAEQTSNLSYQWYKTSDIYNTNFTLEAGQTLEDLAIEGATNATLVASEPGCYALKVDNQFNNDHTETELLDAGVCRVTNMPEKPTIEWRSGEANLWDDAVTIRTGINVPNLRVSLGPCDTFRYEWHKITEDATDFDPVAEDMIDATSPVGGIAVNSASSIQEVPFKPSAYGLYYLILDVELNGAHTYLNTAEELLYGIVYVEEQQ